MLRETSRLLAVVLLCGVGQAGVSLADDTHFIGDLPQGTVELAAITDYRPTDRSRWWKPDGSAATPAPIRFDRRTHHLPVRRDEKAFTFLVRIKYLPADAFRSGKYAPTEEPRYGQRENDRSKAEASRPDGEIESLPAKNLPTDEPRSGQSENDQSTPDAWFPAKNLPTDELSSGQSENDRSTPDAWFPAKNLPTEEPSYEQGKHVRSAAEKPETAWWIYPSPPRPPGSYQPIGGSPYWAISSVLDANENTVPDYMMFSAVVSASAQTADLRVGVSMGAWETVITRTPDSAGTSSFSRDGQQWTVKSYRPERLRNTDSTQVRLALRWREFYGKWDRRLVAVASDGKEHPTVISYTGDNATAVFHNLPLSLIKELRFQVRPYYWVEFENVSLQAGQKTNVKVVSSDDSEDTRE